MCSLKDFPEVRDYSPTENNQTTSLLINRVKPETIGYPNIVIQSHREPLIESLFLPSAQPTMLKKIITKFVNKGFWFAFEEIQTYFKNNPKSSSILRYTLSIMMKFSPRATLKGPENVILPEISRTKIWSSSIIRNMAWHPQMLKLAVVSCQDIVYVYNRKGSEAKFQNKSQSAILSLAWRPLSIGTLAVGCEKGIFIWNIEFSNLHVKPTVNNICKLIRDDHRYVTGLSWNKMGNILISTAVTSKTMYIWDYALKSCVPLRRISSGNLNFVLWSPDNIKVFSCSTNEVFRIWSTDKWTSDKWYVSNHSRIQCACWSPCSFILLFATDSSPIINVIDFRESNVFSGSTNNEKVAWPIIDLKDECVNSKIIGGIVSDMCWDPNGKHLAITFKNSEALVIFQTAIRISIDCIPFCIIQGRLDEIPSTIQFQPTYEFGSLLTIGWSNGNIEYVPFPYACKSKNEVELIETSHSLFNKNTSGQTFSMAPTKNSFIEYL